MRGQLSSCYWNLARPIRKGELSQPNHFRYVDQLCEITANTTPGARGFILLLSAAEFGHVGAVVRAHGGVGYERRSNSGRVSVADG
ncbi:MAG: hypothetical protein ACLP50_02845 [Solirubrobacteraceae bacterium]